MKSYAIPFKHYSQIKNQKKKEKKTNYDENLKKRKNLVRWDPIVSIFL